MTDKQHPVDRLARYLVGDPEPPPGSCERVDAALMAEIAKTTARPVAPRFRTRVWAIVALAAAVVVFMVVQPFTQSPASAALEEIAMVAAEQDPLTASDSSFIYTRSQMQGLGSASKEALGDVPYDFEELYYLVRMDREAWTGSEGTVQIRTTFKKPSFFSETDEDVYYAAGLDIRDEVGKTTTSTVSIPPEEWPEGIDELDQAIRDTIVDDRGLPFDVEYLDVALDILREANISPQLRASTLTLISRLESLELDEPGSGLSAFSVGYTERDVRMRLGFHLDNVGNLIFEEVVTLTQDSERRLPPNTPIFRAVYEPAAEVESLAAP